MKFRKKPVVIEAMQLNCHSDMPGIIQWAHQGLPDIANAIITQDQYCLRIRTLEGEMTATFGDWIIKGVNGEFYPCKNEIFEKTYERVDE